LRLLLEQEAEVQVVGESDAVEGLMSQVVSSGACVVLLDWELPGLRRNGLVSKLRATVPGVRLVALSGRPEERNDALRAGMDAFVSKGDAPEKLLDTLRSLSALR
jgi:DNA-binding NarL/FixJ family response regulator